MFSRTRNLNFGQVVLVIFAALVVLYVLGVVFLNVGVTGHVTPAPPIPHP